MEELLDKADKQADAGAGGGKANHSADRADFEGWKQIRDAFKEQTTQKSAEQTTDGAIASGLHTAGPEAISKANKAANHHPGKPARDDISQKLRRVPNRRGVEGSH